MPTYQFLLHTTGIRLDLGDDEDSPAIGFYTSRRARAKNSQEAYEAIMAKMDRDPDLIDVFKSGHNAGLRPKTEVEQTYIIPWWRSIIPWRNPGLSFYTNDTDNESTEADPQIQESEGIAPNDRSEVSKTNSVCAGLGRVNSHSSVRD